MFKPEDKIPLKNQVVIGANNLKKPDLNNLKKSLNKQNICNYECILITEKAIELKIKNQREKSKKERNKKGMISKDWINKYQNELPCVIIQIIDITFKIIDSNDPTMISEYIMREMGKIKSAFMSSNYILIIRNIFKSNYDLQIKNNILSNIKDIKDRNIIIMNNSNAFDDPIFIKNLSELVLDEINIFFYTKKNNYYYKFENCRQKKEMEFSIKYLIKLFILSFITHKDNINYSYLFKASAFLKQKLDKKNYKFNSYIKSNDNNDNKNEDFMKQILIYFELRNISDYIIYYLAMKKNMKENDINKLVYSHLTLFDVNNFLINKFNNIHSNFSNLTNNVQFYKKYLFLFDCIWKLNWHINKEITIISKDKEKDELTSSNIVFDKDINNYYYFNNLLRLYNFIAKEKDFIENDIINKYKDYKYIQKNNKFIEKIPTYFEIDESAKEKRELNIEESIIFYMNLIIMKNEYILNINAVFDKIQNFIINQKYNPYFFNLIIHNNLIDKNNLEYKDFFIKNSLENLNNDKLIKFPNIYKNYLEILFIIFVKENFEEKLVDKKNKADIAIKYLTISKNRIYSNEEIDLINHLINEKNEKVYNFNCNNMDNNFIEFQITYKNNETLINNNELIKPLDCLNITINLSIKIKGIFLNIEKIQIYFNSEINSSNDNNNKNYISKNYKEIDISNKITNTNSISINFNHLIKNMCYYHFYIDNLKIILKNKNIININNHRNNNNILLYDKNNLEQKIIEIINADSNNKLKIGEKEYYLYSLKYKRAIKNDNIVISEISGKIELKENKNEKIIEEKTKEKKFYLQKINVDNNLDNNLDYKDNNISNYQSTLFYKEKRPIYDDKMHNYNFLIIINKEGEYNLFYNLKFKIIHKECPNESYIFEEKGKIKIYCIQPFDYKYKIESSLYSIYGKDKKIFPKNYPLKFNIFLSNNLDKKVLIKNINFDNNPKHIEIHSPFLGVISKKGKNIILSAGEQFIIPNKLFINEIIESSIGVLKIKWKSLDLDNFEETKNLYNETIIELNSIVTNQINYDIQGNFIHEKNNKIKDFIFYKLKIKNLNNNSKMIQCELFNEDDETFNKKEIISYGKTIVKDILLPNKEIVFLFHFYDSNKKKKNNENIIIDSRYTNLIKIDEYNLDYCNEKGNLSDSINQIFFVPELYSQFNKYN